MAHKSLANYVRKGQFYQSVVEDGSDIIFIVDFNGKILYHNASVEETLGYKPDSLIGKSFFDFILPNTLADFKRNYQTSKRKRYHEGVEFQFLCYDKVYKYLEFNSINLKQKEGLQGLILDCRDITQRKKDAEELMRAQKTKELFLANISHEIRTPINGIAGMATLLSQNPSPQEQLTYLNAIKSAAENLKVIINDILDLASIESGKLKFERIGFNLGDLLKALIDTFTVQAKEKGIDLRLRKPDAEVVLLGDPVRLNQILINLISNAIKFTHHGSIELRVSLDKREAKKCVVRFEVQDTGIGVPHDKLTTIFESFSQADASVTRKYGGTGLGLTIVKQLVELQHGKISVHSQEDKGSTFTVVIPYPLGKAEDVADTVHHTVANISYTLKNLHVLLVEDNDINRLYANSILKNWDCHVEMAENGYVAIEKIKNLSFDLVLMDVQMPVMDGYEATKAIRQGDPSKSRIPIIALTANATQKDIEKCLAAGMNDCIAKPFTPEDLFRILVKYNPTRPVFPTAVPRLTSASHPGIDLSYLQRVSNNNQAFVNEMVQAFLQSIPRSIEEIDHAMQTENPQALARALHKIKPSLTMMGLGEIKEKVVTIEGLSKTTPAHEVHASVEHLLKSLREAFQALNSLSPR